jgi:hypothetical protein
MVIRVTLTCAGSFMDDDGTNGKDGSPVDRREGPHDRFAAVSQQ